MATYKIFAVHLTVHLDCHQYLIYAFKTVMIV